MNENLIFKNENEKVIKNEDGTYSFVNTITFDEKFMDMILKFAKGCSSITIYDEYFFNKCHLALSEFENEVKLCKELYYSIIEKDKNDILDGALISIRYDELFTNSKRIELAEKIDDNNDLVKNEILLDLSINDDKINWFLKDIKDDIVRNILLNKVKMLLVIFNGKLNKRQSLFVIKEIYRELYEMVSIGIDSFIKKHTNDYTCKTYIIKDNSNNLYKIGKSKDPHNREKQLGIGNCNISLIAICEDNIELELHNKYSDYNVKGEWFHLSDTQLSDIIKKCNFKYLLKENSILPLIEQ